MFKLTIPPSSNWNCSRIIDCNNTGVVTYASRNDLIVIKPELTNNGRFVVRSIDTAHKEKILGVILSPDSSNHNGVVTCSADGYVTIWDLETLSPKQSHRSHEVYILLLCIFLSLIILYKFVIILLILIAKVIKSVLI